jgi:hypothetical protein
MALLKTNLNNLLEFFHFKNKRDKNLKEKI